MIGAHNNMTLLAPELVSRSALAKLTDQSHLKILSTPNAGIINRSKHLFIAISASALSGISDTIKEANDIKLLRTLFIREDVPPEWLPQMLSRAELRMARNILVHTSEDWQTPRRIINAWRLGAPRNLIARADVANESLLVLNCALESFEIPFSTIPALSKMPINERKNFRLSATGSYIHWPLSDVHLNIDSFRYVTDEVWRKRCDAKTLIHNKKFGKAIKTFRQESGLGITAIKELSDRQLRRIENEGCRPSINTLAVLAKAHNMETNAYLNKLAEYL